MEVRKPIAPRLVLEAVDEIASAGKSCTPADIVWLYEAGKRVVAPSFYDELYLLDMPCQCGNATLWPLSLGAKLWLENYARRWFRGRHEQTAIAFAMAHAREPQALQRLKNFARAQFAVLKWAAAVSATPAEINRAVAKCLRIDDTELVSVRGPERVEDERSTATDYGDCIALLCHYYGETPAHWLWSVSEEECAALIGRIARVLPMEKADEVSGPKLRALAEFRAIKKHIMERD